MRLGECSLQQQYCTALLEIEIKIWLRRVIFNRRQRIGRMAGLLCTSARLESVYSNVFLRTKHLHIRKLDRSVQWREYAASMDLLWL